jgi:hypothetical protein
MFPNRELLAEIEQGAVTKRYLALPSGIQLYSGLSANESTSPGRKNPFAFLDLSFGVPITALRTAFPLGPSSVSDGESKRDILLQGKPTMISTTRRSELRITYRLEPASVHVNGLWEKLVQNPLSGDYSLVGWTSFGHSPVQICGPPSGRSLPNILRLLLVTRSSATMRDVQFRQKALRHFDPCRS